MFLLLQQVLVLDNVMGVVTAAVVERLGGLGTACNAFIDRPSALEAARSLNIPASHQQVLVSASLAMLQAAKVSGDRSLASACCDATAELARTAMHLLSTMAVPPVLRMVWLCKILAVRQACSGLPAFGGRL